MKKEKTVEIAKEPKTKNYVAEMEIMTQCINKDNKYLTITDNYVCNPHTIVVIPDKPLVERPKKAKPVENDEDGIEEPVNPFQTTVKASLKNFYGVPNQKYKYPQTASQEIGWHQNYVGLLGWSKII